MFTDGFAEGYSRTDSNTERISVKVAFPDEVYRFSIFSPKATLVIKYVSVREQNDTDETFDRISKP